jgi:hypothetical protein
MTMTTNPHRARLEREADSLIKRKIALRQALRSRGAAFSGDDLDKRRCMEDAQRELDRLQRRHDEIRLLLGQPEPTPPVKVQPVEVSRAQIAASEARIAAARARKAVKVTPPVRKVGSYMTKDLAAYKPEFD